MLVFLLLAQATLSPAQAEQIQEDRRIFAPYRACMLKEAHKLYPTGSDFVAIYQAAQSKCADIQTGVTMDLAAASMERAADATENMDSPSTQSRAEENYSHDSIDRFSEELLLEIAKDFVPKADK